MDCYNHDNVTCCCSLWMMQVDINDPTPVEATCSNLIWRLQISKILHFQAILQLDLRWTLTLVCDLWPCKHMNLKMFEGSHVVSIEQVWFQLNFNFSIRPILHFQPILQIDLRFPLTSLTNEGSYVASMTY